jgi:hypothetical protein
MKISPINKRDKVTIIFLDYIYGLWTGMFQIKRKEVLYIKEIDTHKNYLLFSKFLFLYTIRNKW